MTMNVDAVRPFTNTLSVAWMQKDWGIWLFLMVVAAILRIVFYTGYFGSDEVTYIENAFKLLHGDWSVSEYVGSNRYGINLPLAALAYLFGQNEFAANLYSLLCSLGEIALVFYFGRRMLGLRAAVLAATVLVFLPLHAHYAGRIMADAPLALMMTASFLFFWDGETRKQSVSFFIAGLAAGLSFWIKPQVMIYLGIFLVYPLVFWRWDWKWVWMLAAFILAIVGNNIFFWMLTGDFFFIFEVTQARIASGILEEGAVSGTLKLAPEYYLIYLFINIYHTWFTAFLAVSAIVIWWIKRHKLIYRENEAVSFLIWWSVGLILLFSLFATSWNPLIFIPKQTNYMLMFLAPLALLAGYAMAHLRGVILWVAVVFVMVPSTILTAMEQNVIHVFTANSKAAVDFARKHPDSEVFGTTNAVRAATFHNLVNPLSPNVKIRLIGDLLDRTSDKAFTRQASVSRYVIMDMETLPWGIREPIRDIQAVPPCWIQSGVLEPSEFGLGWHMLNVFRQFARVLPKAAQSRVIHSLDNLTKPEPAYVYKIPEMGCDLNENAITQ